jgi:glutathione S-transferase
MTKPNVQHLVLCELEDPEIPGKESLSPFCLKAHRALKLAGLPYERACGDRPDAWKAHNPIGQVPVLLVGGAAICDSTAILRWTVAAAPNAFDAGLDARGRAESWLWEELADSSLNGYLVAARWADERNWPGVRQKYFGKAPWFVRTLIAPRLRAGVIEKLVSRDVWRAGPEACWRRFASTLDDLEARAPGTGFWLGQAPGVADVAMFAQLGSLRTELTPWQNREIEKRPRLVDWLDRVDAATQAREPSLGVLPVHEAPAARRSTEAPNGLRPALTPRTS